LFSRWGGALSSMWAAHPVPYIARQSARLAGPLFSGPTEQPRPTQPVPQRRLQVRMPSPCETSHPGLRAVCPQPLPPLPQSGSALLIQGSGAGIDGEYLPQGQAGGLPKWERADGAALYAVGTVWAATDATRKRVIARSEPHQRRSPSEMQKWEVRGAAGVFERRPTMSVRTQQQETVYPSSPVASKFMLIPVRNATDCQSYDLSCPSRGEGLSSDQGDEEPPPLLLDCDVDAAGDWTSLGEEGRGWHLGGLLELMDKPAPGRQGERDRQALQRVA